MNSTVGLGRVFVRNSHPLLVRQAREGKISLSYSQERLWFLEQLQLLSTACRF